jgi:DNA uptake protein ComE-like DNA-binding protein
VNTRRGFALLAVLWVITALAAVVGLGMGTLRVGAQVSANRLLLTRGRWGAEACLAIAQARGTAHRLQDTGTIDLGRGTRCAWRVDDPTAQLNVNTAAPSALERLGAGLGVSAAVVDTLLRHRPYDDTAGVRDALGADSVLQSFLTVTGPGTVNANAASPMVLLALPGLGLEAVERLAEHRRLERPLSDLDQLASVVIGGRAEFLAHYADLAGLLTFAPSQLLLTATGWVDGAGGPTGLHSTIEILVVPLPERLAVVRRRMW